MLIIHLPIKQVFIEDDHVQGHLEGAETDNPSSDGVYDLGQCF